MKHLFLWITLVLTGCATVDHGAYRPKSGKEKAAFLRADKTCSPADVRNDFHAMENAEIAWAGVINDIQFKETQRAIQVAFRIEHRNFDWKDHGGDKPYRLSAEGDGVFNAGWTVQKPTSITKLKALAKPGYMILVYGKPYQMKNGVIQLSATALRPIKESAYEVLGTVPASKDSTKE